MRAVDLFAGAGGWSTGATVAGLTVVAAVNHWRTAVDSHEANHPTARHYCQDATLLDPRLLPAFDVLLASPACTGHTKARGTDKPHHDASRSTAWCVVNVAEVCRPKWLFIENVPEFQDWACYDAWRSALRALGYQFAPTLILSAADYGVPQERVRLYLVARHGLQTPRVALPAPTPHIPASTTIDWHSGTWSPIASDGRAEATLRKAARCRELWGERSFVRYNGSATSGRPVTAPWGTLTTVDRFGILQGDMMRMPTITEYKRAMGFPESTILTGTRREQTAQLGNAVCPPVATTILTSTL